MKGEGGTQLNLCLWESEKSHKHRTVQGKVYLSHILLLLLKQFSTGKSCDTIGRRDLMLYLIISWKGSSTVFANTFPPNGIHICMCVPVIENFYIVV